MSQYRRALPQLSGQPFLTDGGIETTLIFREGFELPLFAAFTLLSHEAGQAALRKYFEAYAALARQYETGLILESATWRASADWGRKLGYSAAALADINRQAIALLRDIREKHETGKTPMVLSGCLGPRDDGYQPQAWMRADEAQAYHAPQVTSFAQADADMVTALTMTYPEEAIGITQAAAAAGLPVVISFTVETDGRLPNGQPLGEAVAQVDDATQAAPAYYMINCAHPTHFERVLPEGQAWVERLRGVRANASAKSHAELNEATTLDAGDPQALAADYRRLRERFRQLNVLGGCCGTDERHVEAIAQASLKLERR